MICPGCRHDNPERAKFCLECGSVPSVADRLGDPALVASFLSWSRVRVVQDDLDRLRRA